MTGRKKREKTRTQTVEHAQRKPVHKKGSVGGGTDTHISRTSAPMRNTSGRVPIARGSVERTSDQARRVNRNQIHVRTSRQTQISAHPERRESIEQIRRRHAKTQKQKKRKKRIVSTIIIFIVLISLGGCTAFLTPFFNIESVDIVGNAKVELSVIQETVNIPLGTNTFKIMTAKLENELKKIPYIKTANIKRKFPNKITVLVTERQPFYYVQLEEAQKGTAQNDTAQNSTGQAAPSVSVGKYYAVDEDQVVLEEVATPDSRHVNILGTGATSAVLGEKLTIEDDRKFGKIDAFVTAATNEEIMQYITNLDVADMYNITFLFDNRFTVKFGNDVTLERKMKHLKSIIFHDSMMNESGGIIDFTVHEGKAYFSPLP